MIKETRPKVLESTTTRVKTGCGNLYVIISHNGKDPLEIFASLGKAGGCATCQNEALTRSITLGLKYGIPIGEFITELRNLRCPNPFPGEDGVLSCADGIAKVLEKNYGSHQTQRD